MKKRGRFNLQATGIFSLILVVLVSNALIAHRSTSNLYEWQSAVVHTQDVLVQVEKVFSTIKDAESNAHAYVVTGDEVFLNEYKSSRNLISGQADVLSRLVADNSDQTGRLNELQQRLETRVGYLEALVKIRDDEGLDAARELMLSGRGRAEMGKIRSSVSDFQKMEIELLSARAKRTEDSRVTVFRTNITAATICVLITAVAWYAIDRELEKRTRAQALAHAERQHLLATLTSIGDAVVMADSKGAIRLINLVASQLLRSPGVPVGRELSEVLRLRDRTTGEMIENPARTALKTGKPVGPLDTFVLLRPDGSEVPIEISAAPIRDETGRVSGVVIVLRDFSERLRIQEMSKEREYRFRRMFETPLIGVAIGNSAGFLEEANDAYLDLIGYRRGELDEASLSWGGVPDGQSPLSDEAQAELAERGSCKPFERTYLNAAGQQVPVLVSAARLPEEDRIVVYVTDLTASKRAEAALRESESRFRVLSECMPQKVWTACPDGQWDYLNQMLVEYAGRPKEQLTGWGWLELIHPDDKQAYLANWKQCLTTGEMFEIEHRLRKSTGEYRWHLVRALPIYARTTQIMTWLGTNTDIHDQKMSEETLRAEHRRKDQFLAVLAHELRNPLAPLSNAVQVFSAMQNDPPRAAELVDIMQRQIRQMTRLIDDLLDLARINQGRILLRRDRVSVQAIVKVAVESLLPMVNERQHQLTVTLPPQEIWLNADASRVSQILTNLLHNAAKYTHMNGEISLTVQSEGQEVIFRVRDNGPGISPEMLQKVFELFTQAEQTLDRSHGGLGIGLTLVRTLVEMHGGRVTAHSDGVGRGSEFVVRLPTLLEFAAPAKASGKVENRTPLPSLKILVADDIRASANTLALMLRALGQEATAVFDGRAALNRLSEERFDVAFLDIAMPGMDGLEVAREIRLRRDLARLTLVAVTGFGQEEDRQNSKEAGFDEHLVKPTNLDLLKEILQRAGSRIAQARENSN